MIRYSLDTFLLVIAVILMIFAGLAYPNAYWVQIIATTTFATLTVALVAAIAWQKSGRWFWLGFAAVGWGYLLFLYVGGDDATEILLTHSAVVQLDQMLETSMPAAKSPPLRQRSRFKGVYSANLRDASTPSTVPTSSHFHDIGHYAWSLLLGCIGGALSLYRKSAATSG